MKKLTLLITLCFLIVSCTKSSTPSNSTNNNSSSQILTPPQNIYSGQSLFFTSICIDTYNNKWVSTASDGLLKYDGTNWINYNSSNTTITFGTTYGLQSDNNGGVYAITQIGQNAFSNLVQYRNNNWSNYQLPFYATKLFIDESTQSIFFLSLTKDVLKYNGSGSFTDLTNYTTIQLGEPVEDFYIFNSTIYATFNSSPLPDYATGGIIIKPLNANATIKNYSTTSEITADKIITNDGNSIMVFINPSYSIDKLNVFNNGNWSIIPFTASTQKLEAITKLKYSQDGSLWIGDYSDGLAKFSNNTFTFFPVNNSAIDVRDFEIDNSNVKWIASFQKGLIKCTAQ